MHLLLIAAFGAVGVLARYSVAVLVYRYLPGPFPFATLGINVLGSFLIGAVYVLGVERNVLNPELRLGLMTGLLGGFTTFSAFSLETMWFLERGMIGSAALYVLASGTLSIAAAALGLYLTRTTAPLL